MTFEERKKQMKSYLGKVFTIKIDRPIGFVHQKGEYSITYPVNYGFIPGVYGGDGEELDVYLLGVNEPVDKYTARIVGIIYRENDVEDKLIAVPDGIIITKEEVEKSVYFQEKYFDTYIEMLDIEFYDCIAQRGRINGLPDKVVELCKNGVVLFTGQHQFKLYTKEYFQSLIKLLKDNGTKEHSLRLIYNNIEKIEDECGLFLTILHFCKTENIDLSPKSTLHLRIAKYMDVIEIKVTDMMC